MKFGNWFGEKTEFKGNLRFACGCHQGLRRENNEDNFYFDGQYMPEDNHGLPDIIVKEISGEDQGVAAVFDGMGGMDFGELAAYTAAETMRDFLTEETDINQRDIPSLLDELCRIISRKVFQAGMSHGSGKTGTTFAGLYFCNGQVWVCNIGDSPIYLLRDGKMIQVSEEHTDAEFVRAHKLNRKPWLTQYLGVDPEEMQIRAYIKNDAVKYGDRFLICSDGLTDMVSEQEICNILAEGKKPEVTVKKLINAALRGGGNDNITVIICHVK